MRIAIVALGSRGDIQPYIALGQGFKNAGHQVRLITHENFETLVTAYGLEFWTMRGNVQEVAESQTMTDLLEKGNFFAIMAYSAKEAQRVVLHWAQDGLAACRGMDVIIAGIGGVFIGLAFAEKLGLPLVQAYYAPFTPTKAFPSVLLPSGTAKLGRYFNRMSHYFTQQMMWQGSRSADVSARRQVLDLPPAPFLGPFQSPYMRQTPVLYGFSPVVIPRPVDWNERTHVTGYWFLDEQPNWTPPTELMAFLQAGPTPIYIGFGSMSSRKPQETTDLVLQALRETGQRAILFSGWGGLQKDQLPDTVFMVDSIPHSWLFQHVAAVVHHGGAGTTAAGLRAGVPSILTPFFADQPFWGQRVAALGVGPQPIPRSQLTVEALTKAIEQVISDVKMREQAAELGRKIRAEAGVKQAIQVVEQWWGKQ